MRINYETQRPTESMALEHSHSVKAVKELVKVVSQQAGGLREGLVEVTLPFEPSKKEFSNLSGRLLKHHGLEIVYQTRNGEEVILLVQRYKRK